MAQAKFFFQTVLLTSLAFIIFSPGAKSQEPLKAHHNINAYVGLIEFNINYEGAVGYSENSYSKVRVGFGYGEFLTAGEGSYINAAYVHLLGRSTNSHLEINAGGKIMLTNSIDHPSFFEALVPDLYLGYRFEKPTGGLVFRVGINFPTIINVGVGYNF
jgi:hypothetical protein